MKKARYIGKVYDTFGDAVHLEYEYRGRRYWVTDEHNGYSESMYEKHKREQQAIDDAIEAENKPRKEYRVEDTAQYGFDMLYAYWEGEEE